MHSVGTDIIEIERVEKALLRFGDKFLNRVFTEAEVKLYRSSPQALAARFSGKEAVIKTLGIKNIPWKDIEILPDAYGKPWVRLYRRAQERAEILGLGEIAISLSHSREYATACAVAEAKNPYI